MRPYIEAIGRVSEAYTICYPNAGEHYNALSRERMGDVVSPSGENDMSKYLQQFVLLLPCSQHPFELSCVSIFRVFKFLQP
jgi:hypothetical protein